MNPDQCLYWNAVQFEEKYMPFQVRWLIEDRVLLGQTPSNFQAEDMALLDQMMMSYLEKAPSGQLVHFIGDMTEATTSPSLREQRQLGFPKHPNYGWTIMYGLHTKPIMKMIMSIATQLFQARFREVKDMNEALDFLQYIDTTLPDLSSFRVPVQDS